DDTESYVHRIGRTGRAGAEGEALSFVSLDEEGWMMAIERFTGQQIPVQALPEFMPEPDEQAQPIAMGRQVLWGGAGRPPSREVMAAAAKAARREMLERMRSRKASPAAKGAAPSPDAEDATDANDDGAEPAADGEARTRIDPEARRNRNRRRRAKGKGTGAASGQPGKPRP
ncbi:hypothetical protein U6W34_12380, partial [Cutibacterium acnes]